MLLNAIDKGVRLTPSFTTKVWELIEQKHENVSWRTLVGTGVTVWCRYDNLWCRLCSRGDTRVLMHFKGRVTHICVNTLTIISSDNGWSPILRWTIIWTSVGLLLTGPLGTNFSDISIKIRTFTFKKMRLKMSSVKWGPFCIGEGGLT